MKSTHALMIAAVLGILGAGLNYWYLWTRSRQFKAELFIGVSDDAVPISQGDRLLEADLVEVPVPLESADEIRKFAIPWSARKTIEGERVCRAISEPRLLLSDDLKTPPRELDIPEGWAAIGVPIDTRTSTPSLIQPGQLVSFIISSARGGLTADAGSANLVSGFNPSQPGNAELDDADADKPVKPPGATVTIGPFRVLSLGNRLGSTDVMRAARERQVQENVMLIAVKVTKNGELDEKNAQRLVDMLYATNFRQVGIMLHSHKKTN